MLSLGCFRIVVYMFPHIGKGTVVFSVRGGGCTTSIYVIDLFPLTLLATVQLKSTDLNLNKLFFGLETLFQR